MDETHDEKCVSYIISNVFVCVCAGVQLTASRSDHLFMSSFHLCLLHYFSTLIFQSLSFDFFPSLSLSLTHTLGVKRPLLICSAFGCYGNCPDGQDLEFGSSFMS